MADKPEPLPRRHQPTFWSYAIVETCRCGAEIHRPSEVQRPTPVVCGTCRALRVMTIIASRHALILGVVLQAAGCAAAPVPPVQGYAPAYPQYEMRIENRNLAAQPGAVELHQGDIAVCK